MKWAKMKKMVLFFFLVMIAMTLTGCDKDALLANEIKVLTYDELSESQKSFVDQVKKEEGVYYKDSLLVVALGTKPTGGYDITFKDADMKEGVLDLYVQFTEPNEGYMVIEMITYPILLVNLPEKSSIRIIDFMTNQVVFEI